VLLVNQSLTKLDLGGNRITSIGVKSFGMAMQKNNFLLHLGLCNTKFTCNDKMNGVLDKKSDDEEKDGNSITGADTFAVMLKVNTL
jgi:hypothetical protein